MRPSTAAPQIIYGVASSTSAYWQTVADGGYTGVQAGFWFATLWSIQDVSVSGTAYTAGKYGSGISSGYATYNGSTGATVNVAITGVGGNTPTLTSADNGKMQMSVGVYTGDKVRHYVKRALAGADNKTLATYTTAPGGARHKIGGHANLSNIRIYGHMAGAFSGGPSLAQIQALFDAVKVAGRMTDTVDMPATALWNIRATAADISDERGSATMSVVGTPTIIVETNPTWSW